MKDVLRQFAFLSASLTVVILALSQLSCQYDYSSPLPGLLEVRLKTISNNLEFDPLNSFTLKVTSVEAIRANLTRVIVYEDIKAIGRTANVYNTLDFRARDSSLVMGQGNAPPGEYIGVNLIVEPALQVILRGYQIITVIRPEGYTPQLEFRRPFQIKEDQATSIVLTIDLDSTLVEGAFQYYFQPRYYISSIQ
jgi:hypothetical protein